MSDNDKQQGPDNGGSNPWMKSLLIWVGILAALALFVTIFDNRNATAPGDAVAYSDFMAKVNNGEVKSVNISRATGVVSGELSNGGKFRTNAPEDPSMIGTLLAKNVKVSARAEEGPNIWIYLLYQSLPFLLMLGIAFFVIRQMQKGSGSGAMGFGKSRARLLTQKEGKVTFDDVAGIDEAREELQEIVEFLKDPTKFARLGGKIPKGALLVGSPGTGKTLLARAIAGEAGVPFFTISGSDFVEMFVGVGASRVRDMFEQAKKSAPCIVFIDEIDAVGRSRGAGLGNQNDEREQTLNQLLVEMDGFEANEGIIIIAATNRPDVLDPALLRPGRFDRQVQVPRPDIEGRVKILQVHMKKVPLAPDVEPRVIARGTPGFSGADLANLVNEAALLAARRGKRLVAAQEFDDARDKVLMGAERRSMVMTDDEKRMTAYHEAGHALVFAHEPTADPIHKATIIPRGFALGMVQPLPERDSYSYHRDKMHADIAVAFGGRIAEELIFGYDKVSSGASNDIMQATRLARAMVTKWGLSDNVGPLDFSESDESYGYAISRAKPMSDETARLIDSEVKRFVERGLERARQLLTDHIDQLHTIAQALLEYETLTGEEIKRLIAGEDLGRPDPGTTTRPVSVAGTSIPKITKSKGPFGQPTPQGA
ncbi:MULTISPECIES: ATP-dependent zinc metalloprotease FtsH [Sphingomonas]|uniref:ATP-dependent zinc metalloprotease FtsH n=1 Tax=Sphingomonas leidyi TaxID=68569 RepID=A0A7X5ZVX3_9SPHN|nr:MULTISPECIES: ATP-dependent zinc metalloprotease FtsH [Sphingomonas]NIJ65592.1 cell division protease FtsH [Sphingomonas leidyi]OJY50797.1 MAG: cell division protein FtsH [Sphingomonas sp. 67-41]